MVLAERGGFEPPVPQCGTAVFETAPIVHSGTSPPHTSNVYGNMLRHVDGDPQNPIVTLTLPWRNVWRVLIISSIHVPKEYLHAFLRKRGQIWSIYWQLNGKKHNKFLRTKSKRVAEEYLKEFEYRLAKQELGQEADVIMEQLLDLYLEYSKATKTIRSYERHDLPRATRFVDHLRGRGLSRARQITQACGEDYQIGLLDLLTPRIVRHCVYAVSGLLPFAVRKSHLSTNVVENVGEVKVQTNPPRFLSAEEREFCARL